MAWMTSWWVDWEPEWYRECEQRIHIASLWAPPITMRSIEGAERARKPQAEVHEQYSGQPWNYEVIELPVDYYDYWDKQ